MLTESGWDICEHFCEQAAWSAGKLCNQWKTLSEIAEIRKTIASIEKILCTEPFCADRARKKILEIDQKHPENLACFYTLCRPAACQWVPVNQADDETRIRDLEWKRVYLNAKALGKSMEEMLKEI